MSSTLGGAKQASAAVTNGDAYMQTTHAEWVIYSLCVLSMGWAATQTVLLHRMNMDPSKVKSMHGGVQHYDEEDEKEKEQEQDADIPQNPEQCFRQMKHIASLVKSGAITFLKREYTYLAGFCCIFAVIIYFTAEVNSLPYTTCAFLIGAFTSMLCGYLGMLIAVETNWKTTYACNESIEAGFHVAYKGGQVLGFALVGLALFIMMGLLQSYQAWFLPDEYENEEDVIKKHTQLFECVAGYGLGGSTVALFGRVGGGIYTKAADVGADLAGKVCEGLEEDSPKNPGTIADNVGDNVGDIAGMGADLFGSLAEATCAALVVSGSSIDLLSTPDAIFFPMFISAVGILASFIAQFLVAFGEINKENVESKLKMQLVWSSAIMTGLICPCVMILPEDVKIPFGGMAYDVGRWELYGCVALGLWSGLLIGFITEYYTSNQYRPVRNLVDSTRMGAAPNIILGLAVGYESTIVPILALAVTIFYSFNAAGMYGVAMSALGMLGCLPIALAIDGYGPISDNAGGISEMSYLHESVREKTDKLDAAGNTTAAIGKGFAIGSACLVSLSLFGAYISRVEEANGSGNFVVNVLKPITFAGLIVGSMIPYAFSALTMAAVGQAANKMIAEIKQQFIGMKEGKPADFDRCVAISTEASLNYMIAPGILVLFTPLLTGILFSKDCLSGLLAGIIVSGVQIAFSFSNTGGAWDNTKKLITEGSYTIKTETGEDFTFKKKIDGVPTEEFVNAVVGDTVGDPLKDTSGPSINILMKLSAITSLIFGSFVARSGGLIIGA
jgi:inorganic pyrophosphatase